MSDQIMLPEPLPLKGKPRLLVLAPLALALLALPHITLLGQPVSEKRHRAGAALPESGNSTNPAATGSVVPRASEDGCVPSQPCYTSASIANSAANVAGYYAPYSFISIYGTNLSYVTGALGPGDIAGGELPPNGAIQGTEVLVLLNNIPGYIYYVSPSQVNVLIPQILVPGPVTVQLENRSVYGPPVQIMLAAAAPALFQLDATNVLATHGNGPLVTPASPAQPGEIVILYATGLGLTAPAPTPGEIPEAAWPLADLADFEVDLNGAAIDPHLVQYAGSAPGFAGLYQINLQLPDNCPANPQIQVGFGSNLSPPQRYLPAE